MQNVTIRSATFEQCYLRLDGSSVNAFTGPGSGTANCQTDVGDWERLNIQPVAGSSDIVNIGSAAFPNVFLRMDGQDVHTFTAEGGGTVNLQFTAGPFEQFRLETQPDGTTAIASVAFPGTYLRMDGRNAHWDPNGFGIINCQASVGPFEKFHISSGTKPLTRQQLEQAIATYGPVLILHPDEIYVNTSIEYFLEHSKLHDSKTRTDINHPTVDQLPQEGDDKQFFLELEDGGKRGDFSRAKAYVHALWQKGQDYTDLQFWLFYAYNGPATGHINGLIFDTIAHTGDVDLAPMGEHVGDWECVMIRIHNDTKQPIGVWLSQHSGGQMVLEDDISHVFQMDRGTHPIVYSSRNGHANYPVADSNYTEHRKYPNPAILAGIEFFLRNDTKDGGRVLDCSTRYEIISADWLTGADAYAVPKWVTYPFRWGPEGTTSHMSPHTVENIIEAAAGPLAPFLPGYDLRVIAGMILAAFVTDDINGPGAPIKKSTWTGQY
ncbi:hypothetical protein HK104_008269 [Borealophlyctis nickersoniae]|nr:hypothetical protein HK104_008269 [Borealophlyctis nickersoniae]